MVAVSARCGNCLHFKGFKGFPLLTVGQDVDTYDGICFAGPPTAVWLPGSLTTQSSWPPVSKSMRCGAWSPEARPPEPSPPEPED